MTAIRKLVSTSSLTLAAIAVAVAALGVLVMFPSNLRAWQAASWTLVAALACVLALVLASGWILATNRAARTRLRIASFVAGLACLAVVAIGSL